MFESKRNRAAAAKSAKREPSPAHLKDREAALIVAPSEGDANMLYAVGFFVPDPFIFFQHKKTKYAVMSDLEIDRAKKQAHVDRVLSLSLYQKNFASWANPWRPWRTFWTCCSVNVAFVRSSCRRTSPHCLPISCERRVTT